jgi:tyrosine-protein kinase Etk/Wzc
MKPMAQIPMNTIAQDEIDIRRYVDFLAESRSLILKFALGAVLLGTLYAFAAKPVYRSDMLFQIEEGAESARSLLGDVSSAFDIKTAASTEIEILHSRLVASRAVDALHMYIDAKPRYFPLIGTLAAKFNSGLSDPGLLGFGGFAWGHEHIEMNAFDVPDKLKGKAFELEFEGNGVYRLTSPDGEHSFNGRVGNKETFSLPTGPVTIDVTSVQAKPGIRFTLTRNSRADTIQHLQEKLQVLEKAKDSGVIQASLECSDRVLCTQVLHTIGQAYLAQNVDRKTAEARRSLSFLNEQLPQLKAQLEDAERKYTSFRDLNGAVDLSAEGQALLQQSSAAQSKLLELKVQRQDLLTRFAPSNPSIVSIDEQIRELNDSIGAYSQQMKHFPDLEQQAVGLKREVQVDTDLYTSLLNTVQQLKVVQAGKRGTVRLVDDANLPDRPVKPKRALVVALAGILGVGLGIIAALTRKTLRNRVSRPQDIEQYTGLDVLAAIPFSESQRLLVDQSADKRTGLSLLANRQPRDPAIESLRSLRTALHFSMLDAPNNIVMLTGPTPGVGKSFVATNFAAVLATGGKRVLLIDGDLHRGHLNEYFDVSAKNGLAELVAGTKTIDEVTRRNIGSGFDFIPTGALPENPAEVLLSDALRVQLQAISTRYDIVLIDTPPVLAVSDAQIVGAYAGSVFLVARHELNDVGEIQESIKRLGRAGITVKGALLNGFQPRSGGYSYGYPSIGYGGYTSSRVTH